MDLVAWTLAASGLVTDAAGHPMRQMERAAAQAIADGCAKSSPFARDDGRHCAALLVVMAQRESGGQLEIAGDSGKAHGPFQVHDVQPKTWHDAVAAYLPIVLRSMQACPEHPLAVLASGTCTNKAGRAISAARIAEAKRVYATQNEKGGGA